MKFCAIKLTWNVQLMYRLILSANNHRYNVVLCIYIKYLKKWFEKSN